MFKSSINQSLTQSTKKSSPSSSTFFLIISLRCSMELKEKSLTIPLILSKHLLLKFFYTFSCYFIYLNITILNFFPSTSLCFKPLLFISFKRLFKLVISLSRTSTFTSIFSPVKNFPLLNISNYLPYPCLQ